MALTLADRVKETTATEGTGALALAGAVNGFASFASRLAVGDITFYAVILGTQWEVGLGKLTGATTLERTTVLASSNADQLVAFTTGSKEVFVDFPALLASRLSDFAISEATVASAATVDLGAQNSRKIAISGTTTITSFGTKAHAEKLLRFTGACTLTNDATALILPTGANIVTAAGDTALATSDANGNWRVRHYQRADGTPLARGVYVIAESLGTNGYRKWSDGVIEQWGVTNTSIDGTITFPTSFLNNVWSVTATIINANASGSTVLFVATLGSVTLSGVSIYKRYNINGTVGQAGEAAAWRAIGN